MRSLLIANRGEIACRIVRTARAMGLSTVAVFSDADADAPHVRAADCAVRLPGNAPAETYLRGDLMVAAALRAGADAVHPGYGFLSEDAGFARAVQAAGLIWVGPSPEAIETMGNKLRAKALMATVGVPCLPSGSTDLGFPLLIKASAGGGGRGMRIVRTADELDEAVASARREALSAFGDGTVFLERYLERPRHVEVQVVGDSHGTVVALFERDCSVQRRYQKVVEESPSPAVGPELRARLSEAAVAAARAVDYAGVGTVEFVLDRAGAFFFLEMNTRLQVEHPVTELVTGLDLVRLQLLLAQGLPLPPEVAAARLTGHAVEARLYAEDAAFLPQRGTLSCFEVPGDVRVDSGVTAGSVVGVHYDALLAKVIAHAPTRAEASAKLADALARARLHGVVTNRDLLVRLLRSAAWLDNEVDTGFFDRNDPAVLGAPVDTRTHRLHCLAAALAGAAARTRGFPTGWRNVASQLHTASYDGIRVDYAHRRDGLVVQVDGQSLDVRLWSASADRVDLEVDGIRREFLVCGEDVDSCLGHTRLTEDARFPVPASTPAAGSLTAPMPGSVLRVTVTVGDQVTAGDVVVVLEAMKMEHGVRAPVDGVVRELLVGVGDQVDAGTVLLVMAATDSWADRRP